MDFDDIGDFDDPFIDIGSFLELGVKQDAPFEPVAMATSSYVPSPTAPPPLVSFAPSNSPQFLPQGRQVYQPRQQQNQYQPRQNNNQYQPRQQNNNQYQPRQPQNQYQPRQQNQYNPRQANAGQFRARAQNQIRQALTAGRFTTRNASLQNGSGASPIPNGIRMAARHPSAPRPRAPRYQCLAVNNTSVVDIGTILRAGHIPGGGGRPCSPTVAATDLGDDFLDIGKFLAVDIRPGPGGGSPAARRMIGGASLTQIPSPVASSTPYGRQAQARRNSTVPVNSRQDLRTNPFARTSTPAPGQSQARPAFRAQSPAAIRAQRAASNRQQAAAANRQQAAAANRAQAAAISRAHAPLGNRARAPFNNRAQAPFNNRAQAPFNNRAQAPFNNRAQAPFNNRAQAPFNNRAQAPFNNRAQMAVNNRAQMAVNNRARMPLNSRGQAAGANRFSPVNRSQPPASNMATITSQLPPGVTLFKLEKKEPLVIVQPVDGAQQRHTAGGANKRKRAQKFACEICQMVFNQRHYLTRHMHTHNKEDPDAPAAPRRSSRVVALATIKQEPASDDEGAEEAPPPKRHRPAAVAGPSTAGGPAALIVPYITRLDPRSLPAVAAAAARVDYKSRYRHLTLDGRPLPPRMLDVTVRVERVDVRRELSLLRRRQGGARGRWTGGAAAGGGRGFRSVPGEEEVITLSDSDEEEAYLDVGAFLQVDMAGQGPSSRQYRLNPAGAPGGRPAVAGAPGGRPAVAVAPGGRLAPAGGSPGGHSCPVCGRSFSRRDNCRKHVERVHKMRDVSLIALPRPAAPALPPPLPLLPPPPPPPPPPANQDILGDLSKLDESMTHLFRIAQDLDSDITMANILSGGEGIEGEEVDPVDVCNFLQLSMDSPGGGEADEGDPTNGDGSPKASPAEEAGSAGAEGGEGRPVSGGEEVAFLSVTIGSDSSASVDADAVDPLAGGDSEVADDVITGDVVPDDADEIITGDIVPAIAAANPTGRASTRVDRVRLVVAPAGVSPIDGSPQTTDSDPQTTSGTLETTKDRTETTDHRPVETFATRAVVAATVELSDDTECDVRSSTKEPPNGLPRDASMSNGGASLPDSTADPSCDDSVRSSVDSSVDPSANNASSVDSDDPFVSEPGSLLGLQDASSTLIVGTPTASMITSDGIYASGKNLVDVPGGSVDEPSADRNDKKAVKVKSLVNSLVPYDSDMSDSLESYGDDDSGDAGRKATAFVGESVSEKFSCGELPTVGLPIGESQVGGSPIGESSVGASPLGELSFGESPIGGLSDRESPVGECPHDGGQDYLSTPDEPMDIPVEAYKATSDDLEDCLVAYQLTRHFN